jgi:FkbM family methyltransferase
MRASGLALLLVLACQAKGPQRFPERIDPVALRARYGEPVYSQDDEETLIRAFFKDRRGGMFLDVGASDPVKDSTTCYLEKRLGWHGIAVDALSEYAAAYARERPATHFFSYFVGESSGQVRDFFVSPKREFSSGTGEDPRGGPYEKRQVSTIRLDDLLERERVGHIDFLSLDIEGAELQALAGFNIARYRPELVCVEIHSPEHARALTEYFTVHGYREIVAYRAMDPVNRYFAPAP